MRTTSVIILALLCAAGAWAADVNSDYGLTETSAPPQAQIVGTPKTFTWSYGADINPAASRLAAAAVNGKVYRIGGEASGSSRLGWTQEYDPSLNTWTDKDAMPVPASNINAAVWNGKIYIPGGYTGTVYLTNLQVFNPVTGAWTQETAMPVGLLAPAVAVVADTLYVIGGTTSGGTQATVYAYDLVAQTWSTKASMTYARAYFGAAVVNGKIYAVGGYNAGDLSYIEEYDPATDTWSTKTAMPTARGGVGVIAHGGKVYAVGGGWSTYLNTIDVYDPATDTWSTETSMTTGCRTIGVTNLNGIIYVLGGYNSSAFVPYTQRGDLSPTITWSSPADGAVGVHVAQPMIVVFSEAINPTWGYDINPTIPSATCTWNAARDTLIIDPDADLVPATAYTLTLNCPDVNGHPLDDGVIAFTTAAGDSLEYFGSTAANWSGAPRGRGNIFQCDANTIVKEYRWYLNPADTANIWFTIYECDTTAGTYNRVFSRMVRTPDTTAGWYTTGPMNYRMEAGKHYFYCMMWDPSVSVTYYRGTATFPYPASFGALVGQCGGTWTMNTPIIPPQDTLEVPSNAFSGNVAYYLSLLTIPENPAPPILVFEETPGDTAHYYLQAASNLGYKTALTTYWSSFLDSLWNGTNWTMVLVNDFSSGPMSEELDSLNLYLNSGGKMIYFTYDFSSFPAHPFFATLGASYIGDLSTPVNVHANDPSDALFTTPNQITDLYWKNDVYSTNCIRLAPSNGGVAVAYLEGYPGEAGLIANAARRALFNGFESVNYTGDDDFDGKLDIVELIENEIVWLLGPTPIGVEGQPQTLAQDKLMLAPNYPNPFRAGTTIEFSLPKAGQASLKVYNILGQSVATLIEGHLPAGKHTARWNAKGVANGIYLYRLEAGGQRITRKLAVIK